MIELEHLGGARTVTGSKHVLRTSRATVLLDCGLFQGHRDEANRRNRTLSLDASTLDAVVLSHAHLNHSGALPVLGHHGFPGPICATPATRDLCAPMLEDSANLQAADARHIARLIERGIAIDPVTALYDHDDVVATLGSMIGVPYHRRHPIAPGIDLTFLDAGHVLGSAIVVLDIVDGDDRGRLAFTGDLGRPGMPILGDPEIPEKVDWLMTESTYGDRNHPPIAESHDALAAAISRTAARGGKVVIPAFALERAQEIILTLSRLRAREVIPKLPVYLDSPLATKVTEVFKLHPDCYGRDAYELLRGGSPFEFDGLEDTADVEQSKAIDMSSGPAIIIAGSGMCEGGRVLHHLRVMIGDARNTIAIVGFQAENTLGRRIAERRSHVKIFGLQHDVLADVVVLDGFSAHADQRGLVDFAVGVAARGSLKKIVLVHGEVPAQDALAPQLATHGFGDVVAPVLGARVRLVG